MKFFSNWKLLLFLIVLLASVLRFYQLGNIPKGFDADEAAYGYNAYSISQTGKDEFGKLLPLQMESFGEYKPALYSYLTIPSIKIFGLTPFATRLPSAFFGVGSIFMLFFLVKKLLKSNALAIISSLLLAISPWHIMMSRTTSEVVVSSFFILCMVYILLKSKEKVSITSLTLAIVFGVLAIFSYTASSFFVIILSGLFFFFSIKKRGEQISFSKASLIIIIFLIIIGISFSQIGSINRFHEISLFKNPQTTDVLNEQIREDQFTPVILTRIFHNKVVNFSRAIFFNYSQYFTTDFLFLNGGYPFRERIPDLGLFYIWELPFLLVGIYSVFRRNKSELYLLLLWWLLLILPASITFDEIPNVYRTFPIIFPMVIIIALGLCDVYQGARKANHKLIYVPIILFFCFAIWSFGYGVHQYVVHQEVHQPWYRGYAYQPLIEDINKLSPRFDKILVTKGQSTPYIYILFFNKYDPKVYQGEGSPRDAEGLGFGKYQFSGIDCPLSGGKDGTGEVVGNAGTLYVDKGDCVVPTHNARLLSTVYWQDHNPAFKILEFVATSSAVLKTK